MKTLPPFSIPTSRRHKRREGQITLILAVCLVVLLGCASFSVDYGLLLSDRNRLQRACDAAALAGASQLKLSDDTSDTSKARALAVAVAAQNGVTVGSNDVTFSNNNTVISVPATVTRQALFGRFLGIYSKPVATRASASVVAAGSSSTQYVAPIGISWETYYKYKDSRNEISLDFVRQNKDTFGLDDFILFDLRVNSDKSTAHMQDQLTSDEIIPVNLYDWETSLNASDNSEVPKLDNGVRILANRADDPPYNDGGSDSYKPNETSAYQQIVNGTMSRDNPRVVTIIITPSTTRSTVGTFNTQIQAFVQVYLEDVTKKTKAGVEESYLNVRFLPPVSNSDGEYTPDSSGSYGGMRVVSLLS